MMSFLGNLDVKFLSRAKFLSLCVIFFLLTFCYDILHSTKIVLVISQDAGAEIIPFLKIWGIMPATFIMTAIFAFMTRRLEMERVFYAMMAIFLTFFLIFKFVLFPYSDYFTLNGSLDTIRAHLPSGGKGFLAMVKYWHYSLYYLFAELWGNIILNMLLWGFVNEITVFKDAKKFYSSFIFGANVAPMVSGRYCVFFQKSDIVSSMSFYVESIVGASILALGLFFVVNRIHELEKSRLEQAAPEEKPAAAEVIEEQKPKKKKRKEGGFTLRECLTVVKRSRYLAYLSLMVLCYYMVYNLTDVLWTDQVGKRFAGNPMAMTNYLNEVSFAKGFLASFFALFVSGNIIRKLGWFKAALMTPGILVFTCTLFFPLVLSQEFHLTDVFASFFSMPLLQLIVFIGAIQHCLVRASKYTIFDATKEMAFIPLSKKNQRMGKAVIDGLGARVGKAAGSFFIQILLLTFGGLSETIPFLAVFTFVLVILWIYSVKEVRNELQARVDEPL